MPLKFDGKTGEFTACVAHFTGKGKTSEQARKTCGALQAKQEKETKFCTFAKLQLKETKEDFHVSGFVATSHPDQAASEDGRFAGDIIPKGTLQKIVTDINNKYKPQAGAVSERHDHIKAGDLDVPMAGVLALDSVATLEELEDGEWGVKVDTVLAKTNPRYEEVKTNIEQGIYPGFSIEYDNTKFVPTEKEGKMYRLLTDLDIEGFGYAHRRKIANPHAEYTDFGYKEITTIQEKNTKGEIKMTEKKEEDKKPEDAPAEEKKDEAPAATEKKEEAPKEEEKPAEEKETKEIKVSAEDMALLTKFKEEEEKKAKVKEIQPIIDAAVKAELKERGFQDRPLLDNDDKGNPEFKEFDSFSKKLSMKELDDAIAEKAPQVKLGAIYKGAIAEQYKEAARLTDSMMNKGIDIYGNYRRKEMTYPVSEAPDTVAWPKRNAGDRSNFKETGNRIEAKEFHRLQNIEVKGQDTATTGGLQTDTNLASGSWTYGSYFLSPVELNDIFQPILINQLNDQTVTFGRLNKEDWSGRSQIQFRARTGRNATAGGYSEGANLTYGTDFTSTVGRDKFQQPYSYYRVLLAVTGQAQRFAMAPGGMGDVWADEIKWGGQDLLVVLNQAIIGTGAGTSEATSLGFEGLILGTTGTLYGKALSAYATLRSHKESMGGANITLSQLRKMIRLVKVGDGSGASQVHSNSNPSDLVFFGPHLQIDFIKALIQDMQRIVPTSARVGFEGQVEFDGVPFVEDKDMDDNDLFLINTANTKIGMNLPPTLEALPVTADAQAAHIKTYFNLYSDAPGNNYWADNLATS